MTMIDTANSRFAKAIALADNSGQWLRLRDHDGRCRAVGIPSSQPGRYYVVTRTACQCIDYQRHRQACKHIQALEIVLARRQTEPMPARVVLDGLQRMALARNAATYDRIYGKEN